MNEIKSLRVFGLMMAFAFAVLGIFIPYYRDNFVYPVLAALSGLFLLMALFAPAGLRKFREWWIMLGEFLGAVNSRILFSILYLTLFTLIHFFFRLFRRDRMKRRWKAYETTYVVKTAVSNFSDPF